MIWGYPHGGRKPPDPGRKHPKSSGPPRPKIGNKADPCSYGHLLVITCYKWDYTFYKWGFLSTYNWYFGP